MQRTVLFINPGKNHGRRPWMPPLSIPVLGAMVPPNSGWIPRGWDEMAQGSVPPELLDEASLVGISGLTPSRERATKLAEQVKGLGKPVIAGGPDVSGRFAEEESAALLLDFDAICPTQMSVRLMSKILADADNGKLGGVYALEKGEKPDIVVPRRDLLPTKKYFAPNAVRSSDGCKWKCPWCTVGGRGIYPTPLDILKVDLDGMDGRFFLDTADSFGSHPNLVNGVLPLYQRTGMKWGTEATIADLLKHHNGRPLIEHMAEAGCVFVYVGIESVTRELLQLKSSKKQAEQLIALAHRLGIVVIGSFVLDSYGDETEAEIWEMVNWARRNLDFAQFSLSALLVGCELRREALARGDTIPTDPKLFDGAHATTIHKVLSPERRNELLRESYIRFSRMPDILRRTWRAPRAMAWLVFLGSLRYRKGIPA